MWTSKSLVLVVLLLWSWDITRASVAVIAPGQIRLGTEQKIFLLGTDLSSNDRTYLITMCPVNNPSHTFYRERYTIQNDVLQTVPINVNPADLIPKTVESITLRVRSTRSGGIDKSEDIKIDKSPGHLLIQIDKPIYTSRQKVKHRIIAVDEDLKFAPWPVQISLMNPKGHLIDRITKNASDAFNGDFFQLSRSPMKGEWRIRASFENFATDSTAIFEVKDYILPRFGLYVKCNSSALIVGNSSPVKLSVKAEYVYGKPVHGSLSVSVFARIGFEKHYIHEQLQYQLDSTGKIDIIFNDEEIIDYLQSLYYPMLLYVAINATEHGTGNVLRKEFKLTTVSEDAYELLVINEKNYYQPGLSYDLEIQAQKPDGSVAKRLPVEIFVYGQGTTTLTTNNKGRVHKEINSPVNGQLVIKFRPAGLSAEWDIMRVDPVYSVVNGSIKIDARQMPEINQDFEVTVSYTTPPGLYFIMVASRGHVVFHDSYTSGTNGEDVRTIPRHVLPDMIPLARIVVFYMTDDHIVADSMVVEMKKVCREELSMKKVGNTVRYKPKEAGQIRITGGPNMRVGLLAVDKGVFAQKYEKSLTRKTMFDDLLSHDMGSGGGGGDNAVTIFKSAGFTLIRGAEQSYTARIAGELHANSRVETAESPLGMLTKESNPLLRSFFPESWLFQEETLNDQGSSTVDVTYPDSITTWIMYAVGVSPNRGMCVSKIEKVSVFQELFIDLDIPFKAVKLEEVKVKVTVSNYLGYNTEVHLTVTADGVCMLGCEGDTATYNFEVPNDGKVTRSVDILPTRAGDYAIRARVQSALNEDEVEKHILVVSEGEPTTKSITFNLDPNGEDRRDVTVQQAIQRNVQTTIVDLAFPKEAVPDSEAIEITACGDLLGDIINNFVLSSKLPSDMEGAESLMKELAPSCYGLNYLAKLDVLSPEVLHKGRQHIRHGLSELMKYMTPQKAFCLEEVDEDYDIEPSTWFTALVLKTLCTAKTVLGMDEAMFTDGYKWLLEQFRQSGRGRYVVNEIDPRGIPQEGEQLMSEILMSSMSCSYHMDQESANLRRTLIRAYIRNQRRQRRKWRRHQDHLTMAKVAYTLLTLENTGWQIIAKRLKEVRKETNGYIYWSDEMLDEGTPTVFQTKPSSEAIEATSYALMVFVHVNKKIRCRGRITSRTCRYLYLDSDRIAEWLLLWRNADGLFIGASDTAVATEALSKYRTSKRISNINLNVDVSTSPNETFTHLLTFEEDDAFVPQSLEDVPLGQNLHVQTQGSGLGQMHVDTTYNTPIDVNANCRFEFTVERYRQNFQSIQAGNMDLCSVCGNDIYCPRDSFTCQRDITTGGSAVINTYCLKVCVKSNSRYDHGKLDIRVRMLTGYVPNECDIEAQQKLEGGNVVRSSYDEENDFVNIHLKRVSSEELECFGFRILKTRPVFHIKPAIVTLKSYNVDEWTCPREYTGDDESVSRPFYCSFVENNQYRGCTCVNDSCVQCGPPPGERLNLAYYRETAEDALYVFKLRALRSEEQHSTGAKHLIFEVVTVLKNCLNHCFEGHHVIFVTKRECGCPVFVEGVEYWLIGKDYNTYVDSEGNAEHRFFLNKNTFLLSSHRSTNFNRQSRTIEMAMNQNERRRCPSDNASQPC